MNNTPYLAAIDHVKNNQLLSTIRQELLNRYGITACIGSEIEFYAKSLDINQLQEILNDRSTDCKGLLNYREPLIITKEKGRDQFEINLPPTIDIEEHSILINRLKQDLNEIARSLGGRIYLEPKPFADEYGNGMHFHLNFNGDEEWQKFSIEHVAQSLCHYMPQTILAIMPEEDDYLRIDHNFMAPTHVSYGGNNRTVAVRIPDYSPKRLEYRLPSTRTDPLIAIFVMLKSVLLGLNAPHNITNIGRIYGNAFDEQYGLSPLPRSLEAATKLFDAKFFY